MKGLRPENLRTMEDLFAKKFGMHYEDGYIGAFTRQQAEGALPNGTRIIKTKADGPAELRPPGAGGVILGSIGHPDVGLVYFVEWYEQPGVVTAIQAGKLRAV